MLLNVAINVINLNDGSAVLRIESDFNDLIVLFFDEIKVKLHLFNNKTMISNCLR